MSLLSISADAKTVKGEKQGYLTGILYLAPHTIAGIGNLCPDATKGCRAACLYTAGRGAFNSVQTARIAKTKRFKADRAGFMADLVKDIAALVRKAKRAGLIPVVRLNGTSDLPWENIGPVNYDRDGGRFQAANIMAAFPDVQFYDYTKSARRMASMLRGKVNMVESIDWPSNYHLTFSRSECNDKDARIVLSQGGNVAVVFSTRKGEALPAMWHSYRVIDGDGSDARFADDGGPQGQASLDHKGVVVGLRSKGRARKDTSGFVVKGA
jgi:hypothetical protein